MDGACTCNIFQAGPECESPNAETIGILVGSIGGGITIGSSFIIFIIICTRIYSKLIKPRIEIGNKILKNKKMKDPLQQQLLLHQIDAFSATDINSEIDFANKQEVLKIQQKLNPYDWLIKSSEIQLVNKIGSGSFGNVYYGKLRGITEIAIKIANSPLMTSGLIQ